MLQVSLSYSLLKRRRRGLVGNGDGDGEGLMNLVWIFLREKGRSSIYIKKIQIVYFSLMMSIYIYFFKLGKYGPNCHFI